MSAVKVLHKKGGRRILVSDDEDDDPVPAIGRLVCPMPTVPHLESDLESMAEWLRALPFDWQLAPQNLQTHVVNLQSMMRMHTAKTHTPRSGEEIVADYRAVTMCALDTARIAFKLPDPMPPYVAVVDMGGWHAVLHSKSVHLLNSIMLSGRSHKMGAQMNMAIRLVDAETSALREQPGTACASTFLYYTAPFWDLWNSRGVFITTVAQSKEGRVSDGQFAYSPSWENARPCGSLPGCGRTNTGLSEAERNAFLGDFGCSIHNVDVYEGGAACGAACGAVRGALPESPTSTMDTMDPFAHPNTYFIRQIRMIRDLLELTRNQRDEAVKAREAIKISMAEEDRHSLVRKQLVELEKVAGEDTLHLACARADVEARDKELVDVRAKMEEFLSCSRQETFMREEAEEACSSAKAMYESVKVDRERDAKQLVQLKAELALLRSKDRLVEKARLVNDTEMKRVTTEQLNRLSSAEAKVELLLQESNTAESVMAKRDVYVDTLEQRASTLANVESILGHGPSNVHSGDVATTLREWQDESCQTIEGLRKEVKVLKEVKDSHSVALRKKAKSLDDSNATCVTLRKKVKSLDDSNATCVTLREECCSLTKNLEDVQLKHEASLGEIAKERRREKVRMAMAFEVTLRADVALAQGRPLVKETSESSTQADLATEEEVENAQEIEVAASKFAAQGISSHSGSTPSVGPPGVVVKGVAVQGVSANVPPTTSNQTSQASKSAPTAAQPPSSGVSVETTNVNTKTTTVVSSCTETRDSSNPPTQIQTQTSSAATVVVNQGRPNQGRPNPPHKSQRSQRSHAAPAQTALQAPSGAHGAPCGDGHAPVAMGGGQAPHYTAPPNGHFSPMHHPQHAAKGCYYPTPNALAEYGHAACDQYGRPLPTVPYYEGYGDDPDSRLARTASALHELQTHMPWLMTLAGSALSNAKAVNGSYGAPTHHGGYTQPF